jgi:hypothetical protein
LISLPRLRDVSEAAISVAEITPIVEAGRGERRSFFIQTSGVSETVSIKIGLCSRICG